jgi:hypothetical protein
MKATHPKKFELAAIILLSLLVAVHNEAFSQIGKSHVQSIIFDQEKIFYFDGRKPNCRIAKMRIFVEKSHDRG